MTADQLLELDGKLVEVTVTKLDITERFGKLSVVAAGEATGYLRNPADPRDGEEPLPEPVEVMDGVEIDSDDRKRGFERFNTHFQLNPPLVDNGDEELLRFVEGKENSVHGQIVGRRAFFKISVKPPADPKYPPRVSSTLWKVNKRESVTEDAMLAHFARKAAVKKAKEDQEKEFEAVFSGGK